MMQMTTLRWPFLMIVLSSAVFQNIFDMTGWRIGWMIIPEKTMSAL